MERGWTKEVLDHGYVKLIDYMGSDEAIIEDARMSTGRGFISWEPYERCEKCEGTRALGKGNWGARCEHEWKSFPRGDLGLLEHLYRERHTSPFECGGELKIEVYAPIMVFREWHRHRTQSYSELSARYTQMPDVHYLPSPERIQKQSASNKQGSAETLDEELARIIIDDLALDQQNVYTSYENHLGRGVAKEVARINTPVARYSKMRAKTDLHNWLGFCRLRMAKNAQWEIRQYANIVAEILGALWPRTFALFEEWDLHGVRLSRTERRRLVEMLEHAFGGPENFRGRPGSSAESDLKLIRKLAEER